MATGTVFLVGAGPGDPELLTRRGERRLREAEVVLYDALVHPELLELCRPDAELVFVGKRAGQPSARQRRINERLIAEAQACRNVVRLKGGDPYLFGRGSEEAEALSKAGVPFEVIPGVPSPLAATAYAGISLTHRDLASSVAYLTATESAEKDRTSHDWAKLATATQTLVIFMGMRKLRTLMDLLIEHGRSPSTPAAIVQWASLPKQRAVLGTVGTLAELAEGKHMGLPSLIIVGDVVTLRDQLRWFDNKPLFGKRVAVTRPPHQLAELSVALRDAGAEPVEAPAIHITTPEDPGPLRDAAMRSGSYDWVMFTSRNAVEAFFTALGNADARTLASARVFAIGKGTASALRAQGIQADAIATDSRGEGALETLRAELDGPAKLLLPRAEEAREVLPEGLRADGHRVDIVTAYRTAGPDSEMAEKLRQAATCHAWTFTSPSTFHHTLEAVGVDALQQKPIACIGKVTAKAITDAGLPTPAIASEPTMPALVAALASLFV